MTRVFLMQSWRARWRSLLVLALMIAMTGGVAFAALGGARRSATALDRFHDAGQTLDVFIAGDVTTAEPPELLEVLDGPLVESTNDLAFLFVDVDSVGVVFAPTSRRGLQVEEGVLVEGRRADPDDPDEVVLSELGATYLGIGVGDTFEAGSLSQDQADALLDDGTEPTSLDGPPLRLRVVGITRNGFDLTAQGQGTAVTLTTPAFWEKHGDAIGTGSRSHMVRLVDEPGVVEQFTEAVEDAYGDEHLPSINVGQGEAVVADSIAVVTAALLAVGLVIAVAGAVWIGSASARQEALAAPDVEVLRALGATPGERRAVLVGSVLPAYIGGVVLAPVLAVGLSPLLPVGVARRVDPHEGLHVDAQVLIASSAALVVLLGVFAALSAARLVRQGLRSDRDALRLPRLIDRAARSLRPAAGTGVRFALYAPPRASTPVRPALAGAIVGVVGMVAVAVVGASLQRLVATPARWGTTWDVAVAAAALAGDDTDPDGAAAAGPDLDALRADADIAAAAMLLYDEQVTVDGIEAISMTFDPVKGHLTPTVIEGRAPRAADEIALARDTLRDVGVGVGATVTVGSRSQVREEYRVVGVVGFPTIGESTPVATGASLTAAGGDRLRLGDPSGGDDVGARYVVVRWAPGVDQEAALAQRGIEVSRGALEVVASAPIAPPEVRGLDDVQRFPVLLGIALAVLGVIATTHALVVTVQRRRLELGVLSALGFVPAQRRVVILGQATTIAFVAIVAGVPLGVIVGRAAWSAIAGSIGLATDASFPFALLALGGFAIVIALTAIAAVPAHSARRLHVADALHSE